MHTVYEINGRLHTVRAVKDVFFGWSIQINNGPWQTLKHAHPFSGPDLYHLADLFVGKAYPDELYQVLIDEAEATIKREAALVNRQAAIMAQAEAMAVAPVDEELVKVRAELKRVKRQEQRALTQMAYMHLTRRLNLQLVGSVGEVRIRRVRSFISDMMFELTLREGYLLPEACPVTIERPAEAHLAEAFEGIIPFTE